MDIKVPFLGDGIDSATVLSVLVKPGDTIAKEATIFELETDKATAPVPASAGGVVEKIHVKEGDKVSSGTLVVTLVGGAAAAGAPAAAPTGAPALAPAAAPPPLGPSAPISQAPANGAVYTASGGTHAPTSPSVRKTAEALGLDLGRIRGTGKNARIEWEDLRNYVLYLQAQVFQAAASGGNTPAAAPKPALPDFSKWGAIKRSPLSGMRKKIAEKMALSWATIPHVTQFDEADITALNALRKKYAPMYEKKGARLTMTVLIMRAVQKALEKYPHFNASLDENTQELVIKNYFNMGIAVDTEAGLVVPVVRDINTKSLMTLSKDLADISQKARERKLGLESMQGGTFTISNLGSLGVSVFTPIVNHPEVAILGLARGITRPVWEGKKMEMRMFLPLALSYDHRVIDGADGARFIREIVTQLENFDAKELEAR
jgi:pyruvate dehydrogenase E2 component (dihydrolipoamide acetyltransferase)